MKFTFGDIVVVEKNLIGVVVKSWCKSNKTIEYEVYVRDYNSIKLFNENNIERYMVRHKELSEEELEYQNNAINPFLSEKDLEEINRIISIVYGIEKESKNEK